MVYRLCLLYMVYRLCIAVHVAQALCVAVHVAQAYVLLYMVYRLCIAVQGVQAFELLLIAEYQRIILLFLLNYTHLSELELSLSCRSAFSS